MFQDKLKMIGSMEAVLVKANGDVEVTRKDNLIVNGGFDLISDAISNSTRPAAANYIAVGTSNAAVAATQTALTTESARGLGTYSHTVGTKVFTVTYTFPAGVATAGLQEAGVFNASTGGTMLDRVTFAIINKGAADTLTVTFTFTLS